jgi:glutamate-1-semialdehyde aminotransferase
VEIEEIAAAEEDVARLKQRVAELHAQLSQQRQQHGSPLPVVHESYRRGNGQQ